MFVYLLIPPSSPPPPQFGRVQRFVFEKPHAYSLDDKGGGNVTLGGGISVGILNVRNNYYEQLECLK